MVIIPAHGNRASGRLETAVRCLGNRFLCSEFAYAEVTGVEVAYVEAA